MAHTTLLEISCRGSFNFCLFVGGYDIIEDFIQKTVAVLTTYILGFT